MTKITCIQCQANKEIEDRFIEFGSKKINFAEKVKFCSEKCSDLFDAEKNKKRKSETIRNLLATYPSVYKDIKSKDFSDLRKDFFIDANGNHHNCIEKAEGWLGSDYWCFFMNGESGKGKTRFAYFLINKFYWETGHNFDGFSDMYLSSIHTIIKAFTMGLNLESEKFNNQRKEQDKYLNSRILMIDDLGTETPSQSMHIAHILDEREQNNLRTIITTNLTKEDIGARYGQRFLSRVKRGILTKDGKYRR